MARAYRDRRSRSEVTSRPDAPDVLTLPTRHPGVAGDPRDDERAGAGLHEAGHRVRGGIDDRDPVAADLRHPDLAGHDVGIPERAGQRDRRNDGICPSTMRLYLYLIIKTKEGQNTIKLTNGMAEEIGLSRYSKYRALAQLAEAGLVSVEQNNKQSPLVAVLRRAD